MAVVSENTAIVRQIQGFAALLSCLPAGGKARELFSLALALDEGVALDKIGPPSDPESFEGMQEWLESLWASDGLTDEEQKIVDWQSDADNMVGAVEEFKAIAAKLGSA
jgi:hypothetical protein